jgi:hypothetical protein
MAVVSSILGAAYFIFIIISLVKQYESDIPSAVRKFTWLSLVFVCISSFVNYTTMMVLTMRQVLHQPNEMVTQWDIYRAMLDLSPQDSPFVMVLYGFVATCSLILGAFGLVRAMNHRQMSTTTSFPDPNFTGDPGK